MSPTAVCWSAGPLTGVQPEVALAGERRQAHWEVSKCLHPGSETSSEHLTSSASGVTHRVKVQIAHSCVCVSVMDLLILVNVAVLLAAFPLLHSLFSCSPADSCLSGHQLAGKEGIFVLTLHGSVDHS